MSKEPDRSVPDEIRVGISACLLGEAVRYDGGHKLDRTLVETLAVRFTLVPLCPEVDIGMGVPREPIRLSRHGDEIRLEGIESGTDYMERMLRYAAGQVARLQEIGLAGFVLKRDSPSCGAEGVEVYAEDGAATGTGRGLFAGVLISRCPGLPVAEEHTLRDPRLRDDFIERVIACHRRLNLS
jgi:uncharacterized protein YbbK (DUF523 family)